MKKKHSVIFILVNIFTPILVTAIGLYFTKSHPRINYVEAHIGKLTIPILVVSIFVLLLIFNSIFNRKKEIGCSTIHLFLIGLAQLIAFGAIGFVFFVIYILTV